MFAAVMHLAEGLSLETLLAFKGGNVSNLRSGHTEINNNNNNNNNPSTEEQ
jgi:hypothetical protein